MFIPILGSFYSLFFEEKGAFLLWFAGHRGETIRLMFNLEIISFLYGQTIALSL